MGFSANDFGVSRRSTSWQRKSHQSIALRFFAHLGMAASAMTKYCLPPAWVMQVIGVTAPQVRRAAARILFREYDNLEKFLATISGFRCLYP